MVNSESYTHRFFMSTSCLQLQCIQLQVWDTATTNLTLKTSLKIAGQVVSLDSWNDFIAVGSSVVQLIQLKPGADPKRTLYAKGKNRLQVLIALLCSQKCMYSYFV